MKQLRTLAILSFLAAAQMEAGSTGLPWESPLIRLRSSVSGPVMYFIGIVAIIAVVAVCVWHGEVMEVLRKVSGTALALSLGFFAVATVGTLYASSGALV